MSTATLDEVLARLVRVEDELAITKLLLGYGPAADGGLTALAAAGYAEHGVYDWDANGVPHEGRAAVDTMLQHDPHQTFIRGGSAHLTWSPIIQVHGDTATALGYSLVVLHDGEKFNLFRVSAVRWELERIDHRWEVKHRTNRLLDGAQHGRELFVKALSRPGEEVEL